MLALGDAARCWTGDCYYESGDVDGRIAEIKETTSGSTTKFWTHFHEVGHLIELGHVGTGGTTNVHANNSPTAYGVTLQDMQDVMGRGSVRHDWHATPWQQAAEAFTGIKSADWKVFQKRVWPARV